MGISEDRKIPVSDAVSQQHRVPDEIKTLGYTSIKLYIDKRIKLIETHNQKIMEIVRSETIQLREATRGRGGVVMCPDCQEEVAWGHILTHRTRKFTNCRV